MKFEFLYEGMDSNLDEERGQRVYNNDKMDWISDNVGDWLFELYYNDPSLNIKSLPGYSDYIVFLNKRIKKDYENNPQEVIMNLSNNYSIFLNEYNEYEFHRIIKKIEDKYPTIKDKISRYGKGEKNPNEKRGRKPGSKNKPKGGIHPSLKPITKQITPEPTTTPIEPKNEKAPRGRKLGNNSIDKIEAEIERFRKMIDNYTQRIEYLEFMKNKYKKKLGLDESIKKKIVINEEQLMRLIQINKKTNI